LDISSLILITLASELEDELGIDIDDEELGRTDDRRSFKATRQEAAESAATRSESMAPGA
jgi:acyl carrier protein